jgi:hypothetical protein
MRSGEKQRNKGLTPPADIIGVLFNSHSPSYPLPAPCIFLLSMRFLLKQEILSFVEACLGSGKRHEYQPQKLVADYYCCYYCCYF